VAEPLAALLALALAVAPVPSDSPTASPGAADSEPTAASDSDSDTITPPEKPAPAVEGPAEAPSPAVIPGGLCHGSKPCKRLVVLASVAGGLGLSAIVVGGVLAARPQQIDPDDPTKAIAYRPAGSAALAIGLGVLATGLLMTFAAIRASRHAKKGATLATVLHRPLLSW
jgi:hypothetical protein